MNSFILKKSLSEIRKNALNLGTITETECLELYKNNRDFFSFYQISLISLNLERIQKLKEKDKKLLKKIIKTYGKNIKIEIENSINEIIELKKFYLKKSITQKEAERVIHSYILPKAHEVSKDQFKKILKTFSTQQIFECLTTQKSKVIDSLSDLTKLRCLYELSGNELYHILDKFFNSKEDIEESEAIFFDLSFLKDIYIKSDPKLKKFILDNLKRLKAFSSYTVYYVPGEWFPHLNEKLFLHPKFPENWCFVFDDLKEVAKTIKDHYEKFKIFMLNTQIPRFYVNFFSKNESNKKSVNLFLGLCTLMYKLSIEKKDYDFSLKIKNLLLNQLKREPLEPEVIEIIRNENLAESLLIEKKIKRIFIEKCLFLYKRELSSINNTDALIEEYLNILLRENQKEVLQILKENYEKSIIDEEDYQLITNNIISSNEEIKATQSSLEKRIQQKIENLINHDSLKLETIEALAEEHDISIKNIFKLVPDLNLIKFKNDDYVSGLTHYEFFLEQIRRNQPVDSYHKLKEKYLIFTGAVPSLKEEIIKIAIKTLQKYKKEAEWIKKVFPNEELFKYFNKRMKVKLKKKIL